VKKSPGSKTKAHENSNQDWNPFFQVIPVLFPALQAAGHWCEFSHEVNAGRKRAFRFRPARSLGW
jgi:hypothetical protein